MNDRKLLPALRHCSPLSDAEFLSALLLLQPEMQGGIRAPGLPALCERTQRAWSTHAGSTLKRPIGDRERVRPVERAHHDLRGESITDPFDRQQRAVRRDDVAAGLEDKMAVGDLAIGQLD